MPPTYGNGKICYVEIPSNDIRRSAEFYRAVSGWDIRQRGDGSTAFDDAVGELSRSWVTSRPPSREPGLLFDIMVDDAAAAGNDHPEITARSVDPGGYVVGICQEPSPAT